MQVPYHVTTTSQELLRHYHASSESNVHAAHQRQTALTISEALAGQLDAMAPLAQLPEGAQPQDYPRPARGTDRGVRASLSLGGGLICYIICMSPWCRGMNHQRHKVSQTYLKG